MQPVDLRLVGHGVLKISWRCFSDNIGATDGLVKVRAIVDRAANPQRSPVERIDQIDPLRRRGM
jgi:hypothetical protein